MACGNCASNTGWRLHRRRSVRARHPTSGGGRYDMQCWPASRVSRVDARSEYCRWFPGFGSSLHRRTRACGRVNRESFGRPRKVVDPLPLDPDLVFLVVRDQGGLCALEKASDASHMSEARERRGAKAVDVKHAGKLEDRFLGVRALRFVGQEKAAAHRRDVLRRLKIHGPKSDIRDMTPEVDEGPARVVPELAESPMRPERIVGPFGRRPEPEIVIQLRGEGGRLIGSTISRRRCFPGMDLRDLPPLAGAPHLHDPPVVRMIVMDVEMVRSGKLGKITQVH